MISTRLLATLPVVLAQFIAFGSACIPQPPSNGSLPIHYGSDDPADPATLGYFSNHFSLNTRNTTAIIDFYTTVFGFRHIFTIPATEHFTISYLGHSQGGRNSLGYQTTKEIERDMRNSGGLMEILEMSVPDLDLPPSSVKSNTFGHIGIIVPDTQATQARLETLPGVRILKRVGEDTPSEGEIAIANGLPASVLEQISSEERLQIETIVSEINRNFIYVADPDGNILEIQPAI